MSLRIAFDCDGVVADLDSALAEIVTRLFGDAPPPEPPASPESTESPAAQPAAGAGTPTEQAPTPSAAATAQGAPGTDASVPPDGPTEEEVQAAPARFRALTSRQQRQLWEAVRRTENFWESLAETEPGIVARLAALARERGWEVIFITQRPSTAGDTTQLQTQRWLVAHGFDLPSVYVIRGTRGKVADALSLDVVVDDRPENCLDVKLESRARAILVWNADLATLPANTRKLGIEPVAGLGACLDLLTEVPSARPSLFARIKQAIGTSRPDV
jgi:phosphoglycolate phosphatase-like HAD superfamily hydrolase